MWEPIINIRENGLLTKDQFKKTIDEFLSKPSGYLTVDFEELWHINPGGLDQFLEAAYKLQDTDGHLQIVNVSKSHYEDLMNTNISGKRLISLAEIYTARDETQIDAFIHSLVTEHWKFLVEKDTLLYIYRESENSYESAHRNSLGDEPDAEELARRKKEYGLIGCIRKIEAKKPNIIHHLGYGYGEVDKIRLLKYIPVLDFEAEKVSGDLVDGKEVTVRCKTWLPSKGYGFLTYGRTDLFVHYTDIDDANELIKKDMYRCTLQERPGKGWGGINVTHV